MRPAYPSASAGYMVQIAAVSHSEDAFVLVNALRNRGFAATAQHMPDGLIHVRIGPFATHEAASRVCTRLLESGYNAMVQP
jgi:cell division septation protein DedD